MSDKCNQFRCARRAESPIGEAWPGPDQWVERLWDRDDFTWHWPWQPRVCSFCGGVHPEDATKLVSEGWEVASTTKAYKRYLQPPGSQQRFDAMMRDLEGAQIPHDSWSPGPPVKLYTMHFTKEQAAAFNAAMETQT